MARSRTTRPRTGPGAGTSSGPVPVALPRRRSVSDLLRAFGAFLALAVLVVGVPFGLVVFIGWPLPHTMPDLSTLQQQVTPSTFLNVLAVAVWLAWAQFAACVLVEFRGAVSGVGLPTRIPGAGASQALARQLVAALLLISAGAMSFAPGLGSLGQHSSEPIRSAMSISAQQTAGGQHAGQSTGGTQQAGSQQSGSAGSSTSVGTGTTSGATAGTKFYRVEPPEGRHHDSLWEIAQRHLGDGRRYQQIYQLNKDRVQPDGSKLTMAGLIRPGWILEMPADATGGDLVELHEATPSTPAQGPEGGSHAGSGSASGSGGGAAVSSQEAAQVISYAAHGAHPTVEADPVVTQVTASAPVTAPAPEAPAPVTAPVTVTEPKTPEPVAPTPAPEPPVATTTATATTSAAEPSVLLEALAAAPLLAAGLLGALGRKRRAQLWRGAVGLFPETPKGRAADAEDSLRIGADPDEAELLATALRGLSALLADEGRTLPTLYAVWLTADTVFLQLPWSQGLPPAPWTTIEGADGTIGNSWELRRADLTAAYGRAAANAAAAPYPGLVSLGTLNGPRLLMNLEAAPGLITLAGAATDRDAVLDAMAAELATNAWSDQMALTLVGFDCDLAALAPSRIRHLADIDALLTAMEPEADGRRAALDAAGLDAVLTGRGSAANATAWSPHLVLVASVPEPAQAERLARLAADAGRLGIGYVVATGPDELPGTAWELQITPDGRTRAPLLGLDVLAQRLPRTEVDALLQLFAVGSGPRDTPGAPGAQLSGPGHSAPVGLPAAGQVTDLRRLGAPALQAGLLGAFSVSGTGAGLGRTEPERLPQLQEALVLLLLHREGVHPAVLRGALWPAGVTDDVADAFLVRLREWLGRDAQGRRRLTGDDEDGDGRLRLDASVQSDWDLFRSLREVALYGAEDAFDPGVKERTLADALLLVRGPFLADRPHGRYTWLRHELIEAQVPSLVADTALALAALRAARGDSAGAAYAVEQGMLCAPYDDRLVRERLRAVHALGDEARFTALLDELLARAEATPGGRGLPARTQALLDELHPSWRGGIAV